MAVALCALFVALGGASYALTVPRNSVGPNQLRTHAVTSTKLGSGAVTARAIRDGAVSGRKIGPGSVHESVPAAQRSLPVVSVQDFSAVLPANQNGFRTAAATCPANHRVVGGGGGWVGADSTDAIGYGTVAGSRPTPPAAGTDTQNGWEVYGTDAPNPIDRRLMVIAICIAT
jgi:hypothetical protein